MVDAMAGTGMGASGSGAALGTGGSLMGVSDTSSKRWGVDNHGEAVARAVLARLAPVSVAAENEAGDSDQPMGDTKGMPTRGTLPGREGNKTPRRPASPGRRQSR